MQDGRVWGRRLPIEVRISRMKCRRRKRKAINLMEQRFAKEIASLDGKQSLVTATYILVFKSCQDFDLS